MQPTEPIQNDLVAKRKPWSDLLAGVYLFATLLLFLFALTLLVHSSSKLSGPLTETILFATSNPFNGLFIGILITALFQSSSTTTSLVIAFVAAGSITVDNAIPIVMGANIGTTITSTIVSLAFINRKKEFRRAVSAGTYHNFFNVLTAALLFPFEYYYSAVGRAAQALVEYFGIPDWRLVKGVGGSFSFGFQSIIDMLDNLLPPTILAIASIVMLFLSILLFRRFVSKLFETKRSEVVSKVFFRTTPRAFGWGVILTAAIRSSTITTSMVVPLVAKKIVSLRSAAPFIIGSNIGTTVTAFIAVTLSPQAKTAFTIAFAHLLFNITGVILFMLIPGIKEVPLRLSNFIGKLTLKYRLAGLVYILVAFFFIPFMLIYFNREAIKNYELVYERREQNSLSQRSMKINLNTQTGHGEWWSYKNTTGLAPEPERIISVSERGKTFFVGDDFFIFGKPGFCWDAEKGGDYVRTCVDTVMTQYVLARVTLDSVYVFRQTGRQSERTDFYYFSSRPKFLVRHERDSLGRRRVIEKLVSVTLK